MLVTFSELEDVANSLEMTSILCNSLVRYFRHKEPDQQELADFYHDYQIYARKIQESVTTQTKELQVICENLKDKTEIQEFGFVTFNTKI